jgi:uncharacterized glyoxalase superfamily protein PhnB
MADTLHAAVAKQTTATVIPALQYRDAPAAIEFLCRAFGFERNAVYQGEGGLIAHAQLKFGNGMVMLVSRFRSSHHSAARSFANFGIEGH